MKQLTGNALQNGTPRHKREQNCVFVTSEGIELKLAIHFDQFFNLKFGCLHIELANVQTHADINLFEPLIRFQRPLFHCR